jgi:Fe-S cluster assembly protein SufD
MNTSSPIAEQYSAAYQDFAASLVGQQDASVAQLRSSGLHNFAQLGFPQQRLEDWRYTSLNLLNKALFLPTRPTTLSHDDLADFRLAEAWQVVLVNGHFAADLSQLDALPAGVVVQSLNRALQTQPEQITAYLGQAVSEEEHSLIAFNNAWFTDGVFIDIPAGVQLSKPVQIIHLVSDLQALAATRQIVVLQTGAVAEIIETYTGLASQYLTVAVNECFVGEQAELSWYKVQLEGEAAAHFGGTYVKQAALSRFYQQNFAFGGLVARSEIHTDLEQAAECELNGLFLGRNRQHLDNYTRINHLQPEATSREYYKGVLDQRARGVFQGRVSVAKLAQKTDSQMNNRNLLLSADAEIDTKPQLEIYADDVKCAHGVTVGQLDEKALFFLQARGIAAENARQMLTFAFANEMVDKVINPGLLAWLQQRLYQYFPGSQL